MKPLNSPQGGSQTCRRTGLCTEGGIKAQGTGAGADRGGVRWSDDKAFGGRSEFLTDTGGCIGSIIWGGVKCNKYASLGLLRGLQNIMNLKYLDYIPEQSKFSTRGRHSDYDKPSD